METLKEKLKIDSLLKEQDLNEALKKLAEMIMNGYCIANGKHKYRPIEIEFYIYEKDIDNDHKKHADEHVYQRDAEAGRVFFHKSGMDICFASSMKDGRFGGILIRALEREDGKCFGGPRICSFEVLNTASALCIIQLCEEKRSYTAIASKRIGITEWHDSKSNWKDEYYNKDYRFVREGQKPIEMEFDSYDFRLSASAKYKRIYKL